MLSPAAPNAGQITIALDAMGGDHAPASIIGGAHLVHEADPHVQFLLFGDENRLHPVLNRYRSLKDRARIIHTDKMIRGDERPSAALRASKDTSMRLAIESVTEGRADAVVSGGNTGALMAMARTCMKMLPGIHRPALASLFPAKNGNSSVMLDLGANVLVDAETLAQFAVLGGVFARALKNAAQPTIALLNVGTEDAKGPDHVRSAANILANVELPGRYVGFIEADRILTGEVDVIVSDGYAGNTALKAIEGTGMFFATSLRQTFTNDPLSMAGGLFAYMGLRRLKGKVDPRHYNGGVLLGLGGLCVKSHGGSDALGVSSAIRLAAALARHGYTRRVSEDINHLMHQDSFLSHGA